MICVSKCDEQNQYYHESLLQILTYRMIPVRLFPEVCFHIEIRGLRGGTSPRDCQSVTRQDSLQQAAEDIDCTRNSTQNIELINSLEWMVKSDLNQVECEMCDAPGLWVKTD